MHFIINETHKQKSVYTKIVEKQGATLQGKKQKQSWDQSSQGKRQPESSVEEKQ